MTLKSALRWLRSNVLAGILGAIFIAFLTWLAVLLFQTPVKLDSLEEHTKHIPDIDKSLAGLSRGQQEFDKTAAELKENVKKLTEENKTLATSNASLKTNVDNLAGLTQDVRELKKAVDDLRIGKP